MYLKSVTDFDINSHRLGKPNADMVTLVTHFI